MWVLIATIMYVGSGVATTSVDGFSSREACLAFASIYKANTNKDLNIEFIRPIELSTSCVSK